MIPSMFIYLLAIVLFSIFLTSFLEFIQARNLHNKFIYFGYKDNPTKFIYNGQKITIYKDIEYLENKTDNYHSNLFFVTLYINNVPVIGIECFERIFHTERNIRYNLDYDQKEIRAIIKQGVKEWNKKFENKESYKKSVLNKENKNEES